jgi:hypothetical protein
MERNEPESASGRTVSVHGETRLRERAGLKKKAIPRMVQRVLTEGKTKDEVNGKVRDYLIEIENSKASKGISMRAFLYGSHIYLFGIEDVLITTWPLPSEYIKKKRPKEFEYALEEVEEIEER